MDVKKYELSANKLRWQCDPSMFDFDCTKDLAPLREFIGQDRAIKAIDFGLSMKHDGYNIYVAGLSGTGKNTAVKTHIDKILKERRDLKQIKPPLDWCYIYNFNDTDRPQVISLPRGKGKIFRDQINDLLLRLKKELTKAFTSEEYNVKKKSIIEDGQAEQKKIFEKIAEEAQKQNFTFQVTSTGPALIPLIDGKPVSREDYIALDESVRKEIEKKQTDLLEKLQTTFEAIQEIERKTADKIRENDKTVADFTVSKLYDDLVKIFKKYRDVSKYIINLKSYTMNNLEIFIEGEEKAETILGLPASYIKKGGDPFLPFQINIFVDNSDTKGQPVIVETNPNFSNLFGKIERRFLLGGYLSDHTMLKAGSMQKANGGYLLLNATDVLTNQGVWPALKRTLKTKEISIEDPLEQFGLMAPQGLRPQPVPIDIKILLIGEGTIYQLLSMYDEDFWEIFKVKADFDYEIDKTRENMIHFAAFVAGCCEKCEIHHFDRTGVAKTVEYASRMVADQEKLTSRFAQIRELVQEAEHWAVKDGATLVSAQHVEKAVEERYFRHNLPDEKIRNMIGDGTIMIDVDDAVIGQVNGLSVYSLGDISFGKPSRITCKTFLGRGGVINIERESQLSGRIHDKGVLILSGYMGWKYAQDKPLSLSASLCFEQSYEGIDGDSASSTELYALLSSLSGVPISQGIAVTGSVNQKGEIQPIGGVNQKIEGFFRVCQTKGLSGKQGVMIPHQNVKNLMLRQEVLDAVKRGKFHVYAVQTIDEGIEILTGVEAGVRKNGKYPVNTINYKVDKKLKEMAVKLRRFGSPAEKDKESK